MEKQKLFEKAISELNQKDESTNIELEDTKQLTLLLGIRMKEDMAKIKSAWQKEIIDKDLILKKREMEHQLALSNISAIKESEMDKEIQKVKE